MIAHIRVCLWALRVLWQFKTITRLNRLRLWRKSLNLYLCLIGFCDTPQQSTQQLRGAMTGAFISAIYDFETDWQPTKSPNDSFTFSLLDKYVTDERIKKQAKFLFITDWQNQLSTDGLERGTVALRFYNSLIQSTWLEDQIVTHKQLGKQLQMVDDLIDLKEDQQRSHQNCFLTSARQQNLEQVKKFIKSQLFYEIEKRSFGFLLVGAKCRKILNDLSGVIIPLSSLLSVIRLNTIFYSFTATIIGFHIAEQVTFFTFSCAVIFSFITMTIMIFNDIIDSHHDLKKGKIFAYENLFWLVAKYIKLVFITFILLVLVTVHTPTIGFFFIIVWLLGLSYSFIHRWYVVQNIIVAVCSASPLLCGMIYFNNFDINIVILFFIFTSIILLREIAKDIEDQGFDKGYKTTISIVHGHMGATLVMIGICFLPALFVSIYPSILVKATAFNLGYIQFCNARLLTQPKRVKSVIKGIDMFIIIVLVFLLIRPTY
ncbi:MAG: UbiA family prenyltransferase [Patescibacteria group bacterium]